MSKTERDNLCEQIQRIDARIKALSAGNAEHHASRIDNLRTARDNLSEQLTAIARSDNGLKEPVIHKYEYPNHRRRPHGYI